MGCGPIGLSVLMVLKATTNCTVYCFEPLAYRRQKALEVGAYKTFDPLTSDAYGDILAEEPLLLDLVFDCSGEQMAIDDATKILKPGGKLILTGIPPEGKYTFDMDLMRRKEISIVNVRRQNHCVEKSIELIKNGLPVEKMVTHYFDPECTQNAFEMVADYQDGVIKAMVNFS